MQDTGLPQERTVPILRTTTGVAANHVHLETWMMSSESGWFRPSVRLGLLVCAALLGAAPAVQGQAIRGTLVDDGSGTTIAGAAIIVHTPDGERVAWGLTGGAGQFFLVLPGPGEYTVQAEQIGYSNSEPLFISVAEGDTLHHRMGITVQAISLAGLVVEGGRECEIRPSEGETVARVWDEARKALEATNQTSSRGLFRYVLRKFDRRVELDGESVIREDATYDQQWVRKPFVSVSGDRLASLGFVQVDQTGSTFFAPDAEVLLSDHFLDTHCLALADLEDSENGYVGLEFRPIDRGRLIDIRGILWLDATSSRLKRLDFTYDELPGLGRISGRERNRLGGQVTFEGLPTGSWIVRDWVIRMPVLGGGGQQGAGAQPPRRAVLTGFAETGGSVTAVSDRRGVPIESSWTGKISGVVLDAQGSNPIAGTRVWADGVGPITTEMDGRFEFSGFLPGPHEIRYRNALLDSLWATPEEMVVTTRGGEEESVVLRVPSRGRVIGSACRGQDIAAGSAILSGTALHPDTRVPDPEAGVQVVWSGGQEGGERIHVRTSEIGAFVVCGIPPNLPIRVRSVLHGALGPAETLILSRPEGIHRVRLTLPRLTNGT